MTKKNARLGVIYNESVTCPPHLENILWKSLEKLQAAQAAAAAARASIKALSRAARDAEREYLRATDACRQKICEGLRPPMVHRLKTWPVYYDAIETERKTFEVRRADRDFAIGDFLELVRWDPDTGLPTGHEMTVEVSYILRGKDAPGFGVGEDYVVMSFVHPR